MPRVTLKGINTVRRKLADGTLAVYYYHRATGVRLPDDPASPAFVAALAAAENALPAKLDGTIAGLIREFCQSQAWDKLRQSTREIMALNLKAVEKKFGDFPIAALNDRMARVEFLDWHDRLAKEYPRAADAKLAALARVLSWSCDRGKIDRNPIDKFARAYSVDRSDMIWLPEHVDALTRTAPVEIWRAMMLALHTGQRQGDLLRLTWAGYDGASVNLKQSKTGARVYIPCTTALKGMLDALPRGNAVNVLLNSQGLPWTSDAFKKAWAKATESKAFDGLHFHDLRGTAVTMLSEAGCTVQEVAAITGHSLTGAQKILDSYLSRTRHMAESAIAKLEKHPRNASLAKRLQNDGQP